MLRCPHCQKNDNNPHLAKAKAEVERNGDKVFYFQCQKCGGKYAVMYKRCAVVYSGPVTISKKMKLSFS